MLEAIVNGKTNQIEIEGGQLTLNGEKMPLDMLEVQGGKFLHLMHRGHSYMLEILSFDREAKMFRIGFDGRTYEVGIKDRFDQLLKSMGLDAVSKPKINEVKAPMPGLVLSIKVQEGEEVKKGDALLILEAMKMENVIKSPADGVVKQILIKDKQAVDKNQALLQFE